MSVQEFSALVGGIAEGLRDMPLDAGMERHLNEAFQADGEDYRRLSKLCAEGECDGWLMARKAGGIRFGRAIKPCAEAGAFSVDVVRRKDVRGPHHVHTKGEIGALIPLEGAPRFDGRKSGWHVYPPESEHHPTVEGGDAYVLYLLPDGAIGFTGK